MHATLPPWTDHEVLAPSMRMYVAMYLRANTPAHRSRHTDHATCSRVLLAVDDEQRHTRGLLRTLSEAGRSQGFDDRLISSDAQLGGCSTVAARPSFVLCLLWLCAVIAKS